MSEPILSHKTKLSIRAMMCVFAESRKYLEKTYFVGGNEEIKFMDAYHHLCEFLKDMEDKENDNTSTASRT